MSRYDAGKLYDLILIECVDSGYAGVTDLALTLLKKTDSLLFQSIKRSSKNPDHVKEMLFSFRPESDKISENTIMTKHLQTLFDRWKQDGKTSEEDITISLLDGVNALSYVLNIINLPISLVIDNVRTSSLEGPVRFNTPTLNKGNNLSIKARRGELMPCIGRENEIKQIAVTLLRMNKNMPVLIGEAGVGKTAVVEGFAQYLASNQDAHPKLRECSVIEFPVSLFTAGHKYVGETEKFALRVIEELKQNPDIILFLDELHTIIGAGRAEGQTADVAQILKPALARGEIKVIGATTLEEYMNLEKDKAFERRMNPVKIEEPSIENAILMVNGAKEKFEKHHDLSISDEAVKSCVKLSHDYLTNRKLPDKAFDLMGTACARMEAFSKEKKLTGRHILEALVEITGIEIANIDRPMEQKVSEMEAKICSEVIGQDDAVKKIINKLKLAYGGLARRDKPLGVFLFLGFPGCGKTHLAKTIAKQLFGNEQRFLRLDMGEFKEQTSVTRLTGSSAGYIGYEEGGKLTEFIKNNPFSVILFDEIEKCHYEVADVLLSLFGEGRISDGRKRTFDARNTLCIMTSNQGVEEIVNRRTIFLGNIDEDEVEERLKAELDRAFRPELLNRIDEVVVFKKLEIDHLKKIAELHISKLQKRLLELGIELEVRDEVLEILAEESEGMGVGARYLERLVEDRIILPISERRLDGKLEGVKSISVRWDNSEINFILHENRAVKFADAQAMFAKIRSGTPVLIAKTGYP